MSTAVVVITGASRGIGKQLAVDFAAAGYDVVCLARSTGDAPSKLPGTVDETAALVQAAGQRALALPLDVQDEAAVTAVAERVYAEFGRCDVLINNAAVAVPGRTLELPTRRWRLAVDVNLNGPFYLIYAFCPRMAAAGGGSVINISSGASMTPAFGRVSYTVTKRALEALTEGMAHELAPAGVAVNCIRLELSVWSEGYAFTLPGTAQAGAADSREATSAAAAGRAQPGGDLADFEDPVVMSDACLWLAGQPRDFTGHILTIADLRENGAVRPKTRIADRWRGPRE